MENDLKGMEPDKKEFSSKQEKWLSTIQNYMASKDSVTLYNFSQAVCVKINDLEFLEQTLKNIKTILSLKHFKHTSISKPIPGQKFWLNLKIEAASDLKACDINGLSDPYAEVFKDGKCIGTTKTIYKTLDPVWNESFTIECDNSEEIIKLTLNVWDANLYSDPTFCGSTVVSIAPQEFKDMEATRKWVGLAPEGSVSLLFTIDREKGDGYYFYRKCLHRLKDSVSRVESMIISKFSPIINLYISPQTLSNLQGKSSIFKRLSKVNPEVDDLDEERIVDSIDPLLNFLNTNFAVLGNNLIPAVRDRLFLNLWDSFLDALNLLMLPPLSHKPTKQKPLTENELRIVHVWSEALIAFFNHRGRGLSLMTLKSFKYQAFILVLTFYYDRNNIELVKQECTERAIFSFMDASNAFQSDDSDTEDLEDEAERYKELEPLMLRLLRLYGETVFVKKILVEKNGNEITRVLTPVISSTQ